MTGRTGYSEPLLVSIWSFGWNEWPVSLLGLFDPSWVNLSAMWYFLTSLMFYLKNQRILDVVLSSVFGFWFSLEFSSCFRILVQWESKYTFILFSLHTWDHRIVSGVNLSSDTWEIDVVHHSPMPCHERAPDTDLEAAKTTEQCLHKEPLPALASANGASPSKMHSVRKSEEMVQLLD